MWWSSEWSAVHKMSMALADWAHWLKPVTPDNNMKVRWRTAITAAACQTETKLPSSGPDMSQTASQPDKPLSRHKLDIFT